MSERVAALLPVDDALLSRHREVFGDSTASRCLSLGEGLASSPAWRRLRRTAHLAIRPDMGLVGVLGSVLHEDRALLNALGWQVTGLLTRLLPVPYVDVERACFELANRLREHLTEAELLRCRITAIPRGGLVVAGLLGYALQLRPWQVDPAGATSRQSEGLIILVDDCAFSGTRIREWLAAHRGDRVVVALLHAHPAMCRRVEEAESRVRACFAANDLTDHATLRTDYVEWKQRWSERSPLDYWTGDPDHVCYPWNEPDALVWNPVTGEPDSGWRVAPPSWCVKNRAGFTPDDLQLCEAAEGPLRPSSGVLWAAIGEHVLVARRGAKRSILLKGSAVTMWQALVACGEGEPAAESVARSSGMDLDAARTAFQAFVSELESYRFIGAD